MSKLIIPVFFACDNNFVKYTIVAIRSLIEHASKDYEYNIHILNTDIHDDMKAIAMEMDDECFHIKFENVTEYLEKVTDKLPIRDYYSKTTYFRLFIAEMFPEYEKALYLDSDITILGDISKMYNHEIGDNLLGAVKEQVMIQVDTYGEYVENVLGISRYEYFNAGILLINCKEFRNKNVLRQFGQLLNKYTFVVTQDEDYLNVICKGHVYWLETGWNSEVFGEMPCKYEDMYILHYVMTSKPWHYEDCRFFDEFWTYANMTKVGEEIHNILINYSEEEKLRDEISGQRLLTMARREINNENNYYRLYLSNPPKSKDRIDIINKINKFEIEGRFDEDVEEDPPTKELLPDEVDYMRKKLTSKIKTKAAYTMARRFMNSMLDNKQLIIKDIVGIENMNNLDSGAVITCNHFNAMDSFAVQIAYERSAHRGRRKLFRVIREGNYTNFPGFYGMLMRNCNTLPLSSNMSTMKKFIRAVNQLLDEGHFILIYPEQSMWWNYRKPKPLKKGAYTFAAQNNVPILPFFITMEDSDELDNDGFYVQEYTIHISKPIYPNKDLKKADNVEYMKEENYNIWKQIYEDTYDEVLEYKNS